MTQGAIAVDAVPETFSEPHIAEIAPRTQHAALTARAVIGVSCLGAGCWYLLWKLALAFLAGR